MAKKKAKSKKGGGSKSASPSNASRSREEQPAGGGSAAFSPLLWKAGFVLGAPVPASFREDAYADECKDAAAARSAPGGGAAAAAPSPSGRGGGAGKGGGLPLPEAFEDGGVPAFLNPPHRFLSSGSAGHAVAPFVSTLRGDFDKSASELNQIKRAGFADARAVKQMAIAVGEDNPARLVACLEPKAVKSRSELRRICRLETDDPAAAESAYDTLYYRLQAVLLSERHHEGPVPVFAETADEEELALAGVVLAGAGDCDALKKMLDAGLPVNVTTLREKITLLGAACDRDFDCGRYWPRYQGVEVTPEMRERTALMLLEHDASVWSSGRDGRPALQYACEADLVDVVRAMVPSARVNPDFFVPLPFGTPATVAASSGAARVSAYLASLGFHPEEEDAGDPFESRPSALALAVRRGDFPDVRALGAGAEGGLRAVAGADKLAEALVDGLPGCDVRYGDDGTLQKQGRYDGPRSSRRADCVRELLDAGAPVYARGGLPRQFDRPDARAAESGMLLAVLGNAADAVSAYLELGYETLFSAPHGPGGHPLHASAGAFPPAVRLVLKRWSSPTGDLHPVQFQRSAVRLAMARARGSSGEPVPGGVAALVASFVHELPRNPRTGRTLAEEGDLSGLFADSNFRLHGKAAAAARQAQAAGAAPRSRAPDVWADQCELALASGRLDESETLAALAIRARAVTKMGRPLDGIGAVARAMVEHGPHALLWHEFSWQLLRNDRGGAAAVAVRIAHTYAGADHTVVPGAVLDAVEKKARQRQDKVASVDTRDRGYAGLSMSEYRLATDAFERAAELWPQDAEPYVGNAMCLIGKGREFEGVVEAMMAVITSRAGGPDGWPRVGERLDADAAPGDGPADSNAMEVLALALALCVKTLGGETLGQNPRCKHRRVQANALWAYAAAVLMVREDELEGDARAAARTLMLESRSFTRSLGIVPGSGKHTRFVREGSLPGWLGHPRNEFLIAQTRVRENKG